MFVIHFITVNAFQDVNPVACYSDHFKMLLVFKMLTHCYLFSRCWPTVACFQDVDPLLFFFSAGKYCDEEKTSQLLEARQDVDNTCVDVYETGDKMSMK